MFPTPEKVATPGLSAPNAKLEETAQHLVSKLQEGDDCAEEVMGYCVSGGPANGALLWASLGNRLDNKKGCPTALLCLLTMKADPNTKHPKIGPALCWAARNGNKEIVEKLVDAGADMEALDPDDSPALKAAIVAGAAGVAIELIRKGANVQWKHHDGANYLHVITSWLCDGLAAGMNKRMPPEGDEPLKLVDMLIHHGVDPTEKQKWEGKGLSACDTWRARKDTSPWLEDERTFRDFEKVAMGIHKTLTKTSDAVDTKVSANKALKEKKFERACEGYAHARKTLSEAGVDGHHMASLWSNEAICRMQMQDWQGAHDACEAGIKCFSSDELRKKLKHNLDKCNAHLEDIPTGCKAPAEAQKEPAEKTATNVERPKATRSKLENVLGVGTGKEGLYGPEGSKQGVMPKYYKQPINGGEAVIDVPINRENCAKMNLIPMPDMPEPEDEEVEKMNANCVAKDA